MATELTTQSSNLIADAVDDQALNLPAAVAKALRRELLRLADLEDDLAAEESMRLQYWAPRTDEVVGRRAAARILRADADRFVGRAAGSLTPA